MNKPISTSNKIQNNLKIKFNYLYNRFIKLTSPYIVSVLIIMLVVFTFYSNQASSKGNKDLDKFLLYPNMKEVVTSTEVVNIDENYSSEAIKDKSDTIISDDALISPTLSVTDENEVNPLDVYEEEDDPVLKLASLGTVEVYSEGLQDEDSCEFSNHTVAEGETIESIAKKYAISSNTILFGNDMNTKDIIRPGENLVIPCLSNAAKHTVKRGETLSEIAELHAVEPEKILVFNTIENADSIKEGDLLIIPDSLLVKDLRNREKAEEEKKLAAAAKKSTSSSTKKTTSTSTRSSTSSKTEVKTNVTHKGYYILPVGGRVNYRRGIHANNGIDISGNNGYSVLAVAKGTVTRAQCGWNGGYGCVVDIKHPNGTSSRYAHLQSGSIRVKSGQSVSQGQVVGRVGSTGRSTGPHLHFEVHGATNPYLVR